MEQAEAEEDVSRHRDLLTFVLVGGGPTGVRSLEPLVGLSVFQLVETHCNSYRQMAPAEAARAFKGLRTIHTPDEMSELLARTRWPFAVCPKGREFATDSRFLVCCDFLRERVLQSFFPSCKSKIGWRWHEPS